jgi:hypothetical protein
MWIFRSRERPPLEPSIVGGGQSRPGAGTVGRSPTPINAPGESAAQLGTGSEGA